MRFDLKPIIFVLILFYSSTNLLSRDYEINIDEILVNMDLNENDITNLLNEIEYYKSNKVNLADTKITKLSKLPFFTKQISRKVLTFTEKYRDNKDICDSLQLEPIVCYVLNNCTYYNENEEDDVILKKKQKIKKKSQNSLYFRNLTEFPLQKNRGILENKYQGRNFATSSKILLNINDYRIGANLDKDIGEKSITDFYSYFAEKSLEKHYFILGNFKVNSGLGLIFGSSMAMSKYYSIISMNDEIKNQISPDLSSYNIKTFRGIGYSYNDQITDRLNLGISAFLSYQNRSASIDANNNITSIVANNLFRTDTEINKKNNIDEKSIGFVLNLYNDVFSAEYNTIFLQYNNDFQNDRIMLPSKEGLFLHSLGLSYNYKDIKFVNEIALYNSNIALQSNIIIELSRGKGKIGYRYYSPKFHSPFGLNYYENSNLRNETGLLMGYSHQYSHNYKISFAVDYFETLERTYFNLMPAKGIDFEVRNDFKIKNYQSLKVLLNYSNKDIQYSINNNQKTLEKEQKIKSKAVFNWNITPKSLTGVFLEICYSLENLVQQNSIGGLFGINYLYNINDDLNFKIAGIYYNSDDFNSSLYYYNSFYGYNGNIKALYQKGIFGKAEGKYAITNFIKISAQYWINKKNGVEELGSGYNLIKNNYEHYLKIALESKF